MLPQRYSRSSRSLPLVLATTAQTVVNGARLATVNGIEPPTMVALISGMAETAQKLGARCLQVEVEPLDVQSLMKQGFVVTEQLTKLSLI